MKTKEKIITFRIDSESYYKLKKFCRDFDINLSELLRDFCTSLIANQNQNKIINVNININQNKIYNRNVNYNIEKQKLLDSILNYNLSKLLEVAKIQKQRDGFVHADTREKILKILQKIKNLDNKNKEKLKEIFEKI
ncbi:MAG: hypothetical protein QXV63_02090 [Candidatus Aenigmatarchaeota archaeon]